MAIFITPEQPVTPPVELTPEQIEAQRIIAERKLIQDKNRLKLSMLNIAKQNYQTLLKMQNSGIDSVWHNPDMSPANALEALGPEGTKLFKAHGILTDAIVQLALLDLPEGSNPADYISAIGISLPTAEFVYQEDGTVTLK